MSVPRGGALALMLVAGALALGGCGSGDEGPGDGAGGPAPTTSPAVTATSPETTTSPGTSTGTVARGRAVFDSASCSGCHAGAGTRPGFGPRLAEAGLTPAEIERVVVDGRGQMPAGLASGQELADVVAYVASLQ